MSRDTKILLAASGVQIAVAIGKGGPPTSIDAVVNTAKDQMIPLILNLGGLFLLFKLIK